RSGVFGYDYRVGDPTTAAFITCFPPRWRDEDQLVDEATRKRFLEWRLAEATQKSCLEWEATRVRKSELLEASTIQGKVVLMKMAKHATPDEYHAAARALTERDFEALHRLPAVDYSGLPLEQARESLYRIVLGAAAAGPARRARFVALLPGLA